MLPQSVHAIIAGSTGGEGRWLVHVLAHDPRVSVVTALTRSQAKKSASFFSLNDELLRDKVKQVTVHDLNLLDPQVFEGHHIGFSALGTYSAEANKEHEPERFCRMTEIGCNLTLAKAMRTGGVTRYAYLSSSSASQSGSMQMFSRVKGDAERALQNEVEFERSTMVRPFMILGRGQGAKSVHMFSLPDQLFRFIVPSRFRVEAKDVARAMVHSTLCPKLESRCILQNEDIKKFANEYVKTVAMTNTHAL